MKQIIFFILCLFLFVNGFSQNIVITGQVIDFKLNTPMIGVNVYLNSSKHTLTDEEGYFTIFTNNISKNNTLKINFIGYFDINLINLPHNLNTINLNQIPLFEYFAGQDMTESFCGTFDFKCKKLRKKHRKEEQIRVKNYYEARNKEINQYQYSFIGRKYNINTLNHCIDLSFRVSK